MMILTCNYIIISIVIVLISGIGGYLVLKDDCGMAESILLFPALTSLMLLILTVIIGVCTSENITTTYNTESELVSLNDFSSKESKINGSMFLCVGSLNGSSSDTYNVRYASKDDNEVIKINTIEVSDDNVGFVMDDNTKIVITYEAKERKFTKLGKWLFGTDSVGTKEEQTIGYEFHIPKGSIANDIEIDLK